MKLTTLTAPLLLFFCFHAVYAQEEPERVQYVGNLELTAENTDDNSSAEPYEFNVIRYTKGVDIKATEDFEFVWSIETNGALSILRETVNPPPSPEQNFVRVEAPKEALTDEATLTNMDGDGKAMSYTYTDGAGRTTMSSAVEAGPIYQDVVQGHAYNATTGRQDTSFLPYSLAYTKPGAYIADATKEATAFYTNGTPDKQADTRPYTRTTYDARGRVEKILGMGQDWNTGDETTSKYTTFKYGFNKAETVNGEVVGLFSRWLVVDGKPFRSNFRYQDNELIIVETANEQGTKSRVVTNQVGQVLTEQVYDEDLQEWIGDQNVYDDMGRLRFIITAQLELQQFDAFDYTPTDAELEELAHQFEYDGRGRLTREHGPGAGWVEYVYDKWNRVVLKRHEAHYYDGTNASWTFFKYDALNRVVMKGIKVSDETRDELQTQYTSSTASRFEVRNDGVAPGYSTILSLPTSVDEVLSVLFYDDYAFLTSNWDIEGHDFSYQAPSGFNNDKTSLSVKGQVTGSMTRILQDDPTEEKWLNSVVYYDDDLRAIQTLSENHLDGVDVVTHEVTWEGEVTKTLLEHTGTETLKVLNEYEYLHNGALTTVYHNMTQGTTFNDSDRVLMAQYHYNALGELVEKNLHSTDDGQSFAQSVDYRYNIRGWLSSVNNADLEDDEGVTNDDEDDLFGMEIDYTTSHTVDGTTLPARYDGLPVAIRWQQAAGSVDGDEFEKSIYGYDYDGQNRLKSAEYAEGESFTASEGHYKMAVDDNADTDTSPYDANGNLDGIRRWRADTEIDDLEMTYMANSSKLQSVQDLSGDEAGHDDYYIAGDDYAYNDMGNMTRDLNKQIVDIRYNHLQLVSEIVFDDGNTLHYVYDASGNRLTKEIRNVDGNTIARVDYNGTIEYFDGAINQVFTSDGRAYKQNGTFFYEYFLRDHQANNRVAFGYLPERTVDVAPIEDGAKEEAAFEINAVAKTTAENHTPLQQQSLGLTGADPTKTVGLAKVVTITEGDEVELEAWAKYTREDFNNDTHADLLTTLLGTLTGATAATPGAEGADNVLGGLLGDPAAHGLFTNQDDSDQPRAYLQWMFFDESYNFETDGSGFVAVTDDADDAWAKLESGTLTFGEDGYLLLYVANESTNSELVYFDDIKVTHASPEASFKISQINDYYPFGMPSKTYRDGGYVDPGLLYQSAFAEYDSLTGYYDFLSRSYDPAIGRFFAVDPAGQYPSPYVGMGNLPHFGIDPNGETFLGSLAQNLLGSLIRNAGQSGVNSLNGNGSFGQNFLAGGVTTGAVYNSGTGWLYNNSNGYGSLLPLRGGGSPIFSGFASGFGSSINTLGYTGHWTDYDFWVSMGQYQFDGVLPEAVVNSYQSKYVSYLKAPSLSSGGGNTTWQGLANFFKYTPVIGSTLRSSYQASTGSGVNSETLGFVGMGLGVLEEGAANATPLIQRNIPAVSDAGRVVGNWRITSKAGSQALDYVKTGTKVGGGLVVGGSVVLDGMDYANGNISGQRFSYRTAVNGAGFAVGTFFSGGLGALVTGIGILGERAYDTWTNDVLPAMRNAIPTGGWYPPR